jgi:hypothetical protein
MSPGGSWIDWHVVLWETDNLLPATAIFRDDAAAAARVAKSHADANPRIVIRRTRGP